MWKTLSMPTKDLELIGLDAKKYLKRKELFDNGHLRQLMEKARIKELIPYVFDAVYKLEVYKEEAIFYGVNMDQYEHCVKRRFMATRGELPIDYKAKVSFAFFTKMVWALSRTNLHYVDFKNYFNVALDNMWKPIDLKEE